MSAGQGEGVSQKRTPADIGDREGFKNQTILRRSFMEAPYLLDGTVSVTKIEVSSNWSNF